MVCGGKNVEVGGVVWGRFEGFLDGLDGLIIVAISVEILSL